MKRTSSSIDRRLVAVLAAGAIVIAACGDDDDASGDTVDTSATTEAEEPPPATEPEATDPPATDPPATDPPATDPPATDPPATDPPATDPPATSTTSTTVPLGGGSAAPATDPPVTEPPPDGTGDATCLIGNWVITNEEMNAYYDALVAASGIPGFSIDVTSGQVGLMMGPDAYEYSAGFSFEVTVAGTGGSGTSTGSVTGSWSTEGDVVNAETESSNLTLSISVGGVTMDGSDLGNDLLTANPIHQAPYDCAGPTIGFETGVGTPRHPVTLTPA